MDLDLDLDLDLEEMDLPLTPVYTLVHSNTNRHLFYIQGSIEFRSRLVESGTRLGRHWTGLGRH